MSALESKQTFGIGNVAIQAMKNPRTRSLHSHGRMGLIHMLHAPGHVSLFHFGLRHVEVHRGLFLLGGVGHLRDHFIHLFHKVLGAGGGGR